MTLQDVIKGLFVCCLFLEYVSLSQRFIPELINFLVGMLHIAIPQKRLQSKFAWNDKYECAFVFIPQASLQLKIPPSELHVANERPSHLLDRSPELTRKLSSQMLQFPGDPPDTSAICVEAFFFHTASKPP